MDNLAILLIDMQKNFLKNNPEESLEIIKKQIEFFQATKNKKFPTFVLEYKYFKETNPTIKKELENQDVTYLTKESDGGFETVKHNGRIIDTAQKWMFGENGSLAFEETELDYLLKQKDILNLLLTGINKYGCVYQTGLEAKDRNYNIITCDELLNGKNHKHVKGEKWYKEETTNYKTLTELLQNL